MIQSATNSLPGYKMFCRIDSTKWRSHRLSMCRRTLGESLSFEDSESFLSACNEAISTGRETETLVEIEGMFVALSFRSHRNRIVNCTHQVL